MPLYMDRHDVSEEVTAEVVAQIHAEDLKIQHKYGCRGLTYWFDADRKTAFCLVEAPNAEAIREMHKDAHGEVPNVIIEVAADVVESFLGRIEDPEKSQKTKLNIINDPAFRTIMVARIKCISIVKSADEKMNLHIESNNENIVELIEKFKGRIVKHKDDYYLTSFQSVTKAVLCALAIQELFNQTNTNYDSFVELNIGLSAGVPVGDKEGFFEDTVRIAEHLCDVVKGQVSVSSDVKELYESENLNISIDINYLNSISSNDEKFLNLLMDYTDKEWKNSSLNADSFSKSLGYSKSQLYRKMIYLTGKSPISFINEYRLNKALGLFNNKDMNISDVAYETGFNSPAYFSKCFQNNFGILPSTYIKHYTNAF